MSAKLVDNIIHVKAKFSTEIKHNFVADYNLLENKPQINDVTLEGNKSLNDIGVQKISNMEIETMIQNIFG